MGRRVQFHYGRARTARLLAALSCSLVVASVGLLPLLLMSSFYGAVASFGLVLLTLGVLVAAVDRGSDFGLLFEYELRRRFREVCIQKNLTKTDDQGATLYPRLTGLIGHSDAWQAHVRPLLGQSLADWDRAAPAFTMAYAVAGVRMADNGDGSLSIRAGYQKLEVREFVVNESDYDGGLSWRERLGSVVVGTTEGGQPYPLPFLDSHILIAGITGSGKGSVIWSLILGLLPAYRAGVVRFVGLDPKRMELAIGRGLFADSYATTDEAMVKLLEDEAARMLRRADELAGRVRKFEPSPEHPVNVVVIDELGYLSALLPDRKLRDRAEKALSAILVLGRSVGWVCVGALQDPRKETLSFRDYFPTRVALKLEKPMVDLVLGAGAHEAGALCDQIPPPKLGGAGVAFVKSEGSGAPVCVRMTWCPDDLIRAVAGELPPPPPVLQIAN